MEEYIETGRIVNTHGIKGDIKIEYWCDDFKAFSGYGKLFTKENGRFFLHDVKKCQKLKNLALVHFGDISSVDEAEKYKNSIVYVIKDDIIIPEGKVLIKDILNKKIKDFNTGRIYGILTDVIEVSGRQYYEIESEDKRKYLMPAAREFVKSADEGEFIIISPPEGLFDEI